MNNLSPDINQHFGTALGATEAEAAGLPTLGDHLPEIKEYLRGENPRISSAAAMVKTTPPGRGSRLLPVDGDNPPTVVVVPRKWMSMSLHRAKRSAISRATGASAVSMPPSVSSENTTPNPKASSARLRS